jgi:hypothetical protein
MVLLIAKVLFGRTLAGVLLDEKVLIRCYQWNDLALETPVHLEFRLVQGEHPAVTLELGPKPFKCFLFRARSPKPLLTQPHKSAAKSKAD